MPLSISIWSSANYITNNALIATVKSIQKQLDARNYTTGISVDLKKAFDRVDTIFYLRNLITVV